MVDLFIKQQPNYKFTILFPETKKFVSKSFSFFSQRTPMAVVRFLSDITCQEFYGKKNLKIILKHTTYTPTGRKKFKTITYYRHLIGDFTLDQIMTGFKNRVAKDSASLNTKSTRFSLCIRNNISQETDTKYLTFNHNDSYNDVFSFLQSVLQKIEQEQQKGMIYISDKPIKSSHSLVLFKSGSMQNLKQPTKSFSVNIPYFSSEEIVDLITGGNNNGQ